MEAEHTERKISLARQLWASRMEQVERALRRGMDTLTIQDVTDMLEAGEAQVWFTENSTAVTHLYDRGGKRICEIWLAGGDFEELVAMKDQEIEPWAELMGVDRMLIMGRKGWERALPDYSYAHTTLMKELR